MPIASRPNSWLVILMIANQAIVPSTAAPAPNSSPRGSEPPPCFDPDRAPAQGRQMMLPAISKYSPSIGRLQSRQARASFGVARSTLSNCIPAPGVPSIPPAPALSPLLGSLSPRAIGWEPTEGFPQRPHQRRGELLALRAHADPKFAQRGLAVVGVQHPHL